MFPHLLLYRALVECIINHVDVESWIELNNGSQSTPPLVLDQDNNGFLESVDPLNEDYEINNVLSSEDITDEEEPSQQQEVGDLSRSQSDNDLDRSLNTLLRNNDKKLSQQQYTPVRSQYHNSRISVDSLRLVSEDNEKAGHSKKREQSSSTRNKRKKIKSDNSNMDLTSITFAAAAGISLVAGLSFSAGYAFGRRSMVKVTA